MKRYSHTPNQWLACAIGLLLLLGVCIILFVVGQPTRYDANMIHKTGQDTADKHRFTNALADQTSPYLLQHAHNPVDWRPWGEDAFAEARRRDVPIFLSIGYSTCYWCHVMERQVFEDETLAKQMNDQFVCIKVDREERPDVDDIYMTATQLLTGSGGWPMSVFLTPPATEDEQGKAGWGLKPFWAGTYIPPQRMHGRPGFGEVMHAISGFWKDERQDVLDQAERVADAVKQQMSQGANAGAVGAALVEQAAHQLLARYDAEHGGFSGPQGPKFPTPVTLGLLQAVQQNNPQKALGEALDHTLDRMARGGMYDQVGGGFHRYSVDEQWLVPHFEKMLYDNGQLLELYAQAHAAKPDARSSTLYARVIRETAAYLKREMLDESGAFWSAQDAEVNTMEGGNYVWTPEQVREALADHADAKRLTPLALKMYGLDRGTNFQDPHHPNAPAVNVLYMPEPMSEVADGYEGSMADLMRDREAINAAMLAVRDKRDQPSTDDKVLAGWNGLIIAGLARGGAVLDEPELVEMAAGAADAVLQDMSQPDGGLYRSMRAGESKIPAFLEDYAFVIHGLLALHKALPEGRAAVYLQHAQRLMAYADQHFATPGGGYYDTLEGQADLFVRSRSTYDGAIASGNSQMIHNLIDLHAITKDSKYLEQAATDLQSFATPMRESGAGMSHMVHALLRWLEVATPAMIEQMNAINKVLADDAVVTAEVAPGSIKQLPNGIITAVLKLNIAEGFHINASRDLPEGLLPTQVVATGDDWEATAVYPQAKLLETPFTDEPLPVYEGGVSLPVSLQRKGEGATESEITLVVHYQACDDQKCLRPANLTVKIGLPAQ